MSGFLGDVRLFPTDADGQSASDVPVTQEYGLVNAVNLAQVNGLIYMSQSTAGQVVQLNDDGTYNHLVISGLGANPGAAGMAANTATGHIFVSVYSNNQILDLDPLAGVASQFASVTNPDGLTLSADGSILYVSSADLSGTARILGLDTSTGGVVFDSGVIPGDPDGVAEGTGPLAGNIYVNTFGGTIVEVNLDTLAQTVVASGGSRGAYVKTDPNDGSALFTQTDRIVRLSFPAGPATSFQVVAPAKVQAGTPFDVTGTALDAFGHVATGYIGTVTFSTTDPDPGVVLPAAYTFTPADGGVHTFTNTGLGETTLITPGDQTLTVMDTTDNTITGSVIITVSSTAPEMDSHGPGSQPEASRFPGSAPQVSEPPHRPVVAVDWWFATLNKRDVGFVLASPIRHARAGADSWALDPWWSDEPLFT